MNIEDLKFARLRGNPFHAIPSDRVEVWAGLHDLRDSLENIVTVVRNDKVGTSEFVALHGEYGTGKSHALRYLRTLIEERKKDEFLSKCIYLDTLRVADKLTFLEIYRTILHNIGRTAIEEFAALLIGRIEMKRQALVDQLPESEARQALRGLDGQKTLRSQAVQATIGNYARMYPLLEKLAGGDDDAWSYISASKQKASKTLLKAIDKLTDIASDYEAVGSLSMIVNLTCGISLENDRFYWKAFYLLVDEVEVINALEPKVQVALNHAFRDLLNACPEHLCMMFGLTGEAADVEIIFATALLDRMTRLPIEIPTLDAGQALEFIREVLKFSRPGKTGKEDDPWHPFTKEAVEYIIDNTPSKTPRHLFIGARKVLLLAAGEGILRRGKKITREDAERLLI